MPREPDNAAAAPAPEVAGKLMDWSREGHESVENG